jgi:ubiquinone biosynthesis protein
MADIAALFRLARAGLTLARAGAFDLVATDPLPAGPRSVVRFARLFGPRGISDGERAERLNVALNRLGPSYIKFGQFLATRPDLVGQDASLVFGRLRDEIAPFPQAEAEATVARALGQPIAALFTSFSAPVAAASIAQVHKATVAAADGPRSCAPACVTASAAISRRSSPARASSSASIRPRAG